MSKTILTQVDGFTPLPDLLVNRYGVITAAVWGRVWRYCQMSDGICRATLDKIAEGLDLSRQTIIKHIETLVADGFLLDKTPELKNKPHTYVDTGKVAMYNRFGFAVNEIDSAVNLIDSAVNEIDSQSQFSLHEDSIKDRNKEIPYDRKKGIEQAKERKAKQRASKGDLFDLLKEQGEKEQVLRDMEDRIFKATRLTVNDRWYKERVMDFLIERDNAGETIETFAEKCKDDPYNMPKFFKIAEKPSYLKDVWGLAFQEETNTEEEWETL